MSIENVAVEDFTVAPGAFAGSLIIGAFFLLVAALLNISMGHFVGVSPWIIAIPSLLLSIISILAVVFEFILYFEFLDPFFKKKKSINVIGTLREPGIENVKRLLIISGHHDSALELTWLRFLKHGFFIAIATMFIGFATMLAMSIIQLAGIATGNADLIRTGTLGYASLAYPIVPAIILAVFFNRGRRNGGIVPGAVDNLSACALSLATCRFLARNPSYIPDDTEVKFISFGSEEAGLRGSRRYVERHLADLKRMDAKLLNLEMVAHPEIAILTTDVNGTVKNSHEMVKSVVAAAELAGVPFKVKPYPPGGGGSDAGPFSQAGLRATTLLPFKMPEQMIAFHHQKWDNYDVLTKEPMLNVLRLMFEWVSNGGE